MFLIDFRIKPAMTAPVSIPLYIASALANGGSEANPSTTAKPDLAVALNGWLESSKKCQK
jgi:hypothetical protein